MRRDSLLKRVDVAATDQAKRNAEIETQNAHELLELFRSAETF
jgi:hypothetical protein